MSLSYVLLLFLLFTSTVFIGIMLLLLLFCMQIVLLYLLGQQSFVLFLLGVYVGAILVFFVFVVMTFMFFGKNYRLSAVQWRSVAAYIQLLCLMFFLGIFFQYVLGWTSLCYAATENTLSMVHSCSMGSMVSEIGLLLMIHWVILCGLLGICAICIIIWQFLTIPDESMEEVMSQFNRYVDLFSLYVYHPFCWAILLYYCYSNVSCILFVVILFAHYLLCAVLGYLYDVSEEDLVIRFLFDGLVILHTASLHMAELLVGSFFFFCGELHCYELGLLVIVHSLGGLAAAIMCANVRYQFFDWSDWYVHIIYFGRSLPLLVGFFFTFYVLSGYWLTGLISNMNMLIYRRVVVFMSILLYIVSAKAVGNVLELIRGDASYGFSLIYLCYFLVGLMLFVYVCLVIYVGICYLSILC